METVTFPRRGETFAPLADDKKDGHVRCHTIQTIDVPAETLYNIWRNEDLLPLWMEGVVKVCKTGPRTSHWVMQAPGTEKQVEFDGEVIDDVPGKHLSSRVVSGFGEGTTEDVTFEPHPAGRGTIVTYIVDYVVPGGIVANAAAALASRSPRQMSIESLRHLKQLAESGEIPRADMISARPPGVMGRWKEFLLGETNPTPPGTSEHPQAQDMPKINRLGDNNQKEVA